MDVDVEENGSFNIKTFESKCIQTHIRFYSERGIQVETRKFEDGSTRVSVCKTGEMTNLEDHVFDSIFRRMTI